ncbi:MAG: hypothetical protein ACKV0T_25895 [Planctomycetales bacterium]
MLATTLSACQDGLDNCHQIVEGTMARNITRTGKRLRPKTAVKGKRYLCASCRKRSPQPVAAPAPWYCPSCLKNKELSE